MMYCKCQHFCPLITITLCLHDKQRSTEHRPYHDDMQSWTVVASHGDITVNCVINYIVNSIDKKYTVYSDLRGHTAPELCVTVQKPDIVIIENHTKSIHLHELTCPAERNIDIRNIEKSNKYAHFTTDITHLSCKVNCFEVSPGDFAIPETIPR